MILTPEEAAFILKKLEYTFKKKSGHLVIEKLKTDVDIEIDDTEKDLIDLVKKAGGKDYEYDLYAKGYSDKQGPMYSLIIRRIK